MEGVTVHVCSADEGQQATSPKQLSRAPHLISLGITWSNTIMWWLLYLFLYLPIYLWLWTIISWVQYGPANSCIRTRSVPPLREPLHQTPCLWYLINYLLLVFPVANSLLPSPCTIRSLPASSLWNGSIRTSELLTRSRKNSGPPELCILPNRCIAKCQGRCTFA